GSSEFADEEMFQPTDKKCRIFVVRERSAGARPTLPQALATAGGPVPRDASHLPLPSSLAEVHLAALEAAVPPSVMIDQRWNVLHVSPSASRFFQQSGGPLAQRITDLVRPELRDDLHAFTASCVRVARAAALGIYFGHFQRNSSSRGGAHSPAG